MNIGDYVRVLPGNSSMDGIGKITGYADDDYDNAKELGYYIVNFGNIYGTCTVNKDYMQKISDDVYDCEFCKTPILWDGSDDHRGELWSCEQIDCGKTFCVACFKEKYGFEVWQEHINESSIETGIMCPECMERKMFWDSDIILEEDLEEFLLKNKYDVYDDPNDIEDRVIDSCKVIEIARKNGFIIINPDDEDKHHNGYVFEKQVLTNG